MTQRSLPFLILLILLSSATSFADVKQEKALCRVCEIHDGETEKEDIVASLEYEGLFYGFCSDGCRDKFLDFPEAYAKPVFPRPAPSFQAVDFEGKEVSSEEFKGRIVLLDFWATWCPPCVQDLPELSRLHKKYEEQGVTVLGLSIDEADGAARKVSRMLQRKKASHPVLLDTSDSPAWAAYHVRAVPAQFLIDGDGQIVRQWLGTTDLEEVEEAIRELLAKSEEPAS